MKETTTLKIEAFQNQYGTLELDYIWLSTNVNDFKNNQYFACPASEGNAKTGYEVSYRSNSLNSTKQTLHLGEYTNGSVSFNVPVSEGTVYLKIRYSNFTPDNHNSIRVYYDEQMLIEHTPKETGDWNNFKEEVFKIELNK